MRPQQGIPMPSLRSAQNLFPVAFLYPVDEEKELTVSWKRGGVIVLAAHLFLLKIRRLGEGVGSEKNYKQIFCNPVIFFSLSAYKQIISLKRLFI